MLLFNRCSRKILWSILIRPSMSSKSCPYDNSSMVNFFGTLKSECLNRMKFTDTIQLEKAVEEYVHFNSYERSTMKNGLTPFEYGAKPRNLEFFYDRRFFLVYLLGNSPSFGAAIFCCCKTRFGSSGRQAFSPGAEPVREGMEQPFARRRPSFVRKCRKGTARPSACRRS